MPTPAVVLANQKLALRSDKDSFRQFALSDVEIVSENTDWRPSCFVIEGASCGGDPANLPVRTDDAEFKIEHITAPHRSVSFAFNCLDLSVWMDTIAKI